MLKCLVNINGRILLRPVRLEDVWNITHYHYIIDLMRSIMRVEDRYYAHYGQSHYERAFAYELYYQWSRFIKRYQKRLNKNICLNAEVKKFLLGEKKLPDMVMHEDGGDNQEIVAEIKRLPSANINLVIEDLKKLKNFTTGQIGIEDNVGNLMGFSPYKYGVFIAIQGNIDELANLLVKKYITIKNIKNELEQQGKLNQMYCICCPHSGSIEFASLEILYEYIQQKRNNKKV